MVYESQERHLNWRDNKMEIISMNDILRMFHTAKLNLNDDGTRSKEYHQIMKKNWINHSKMIKLVKKIQKDRGTHKCQRILNTLKLKKE